MIKKIKNLWYRIVGWFERHKVFCPQCHVAMKRIAHESQSIGTKIASIAHQCPVCNGVDLR